MADVLTFNPVAISAAARHPGGAFTPEVIQDVLGSKPGGQPQTFTTAVVLSGAPPFGGNATLTKVGSAAWLTVPETAEDGVAFDVVIDASDLKARDYSETIRASKAGYDDADLAVEVAVRPMG